MGRSRPPRSTPRRPSVPAKVTGSNPALADGRAGQADLGRGRRRPSRRSSTSRWSRPPSSPGSRARACRLIKTGEQVGAISTYGQGLGQILVFQSKAQAGKNSALAPAGLTLPQVNIDGATGSELATALGTFLTFERAGVQYVVVGSVPPIAAENAARGLK